MTIRKKATTVRLAKHLAKRHCVIWIEPNQLHNPNNQQCGPRAIAVSLAKLLKHRRYNVIRKCDQKAQIDFDLQLCKEAKVVPGRCSWDDIKKFADMLGSKYDCQFLVFGGEMKCAATFEFTSRTNVVALLHTNNHFDVVTRPWVIRGKNFRCPICGEFGTTRRDHSCYKPCEACFQTTCKSLKEQSLLCPDCHRTF